MEQNPERERTAGAETARRTVRLLGTLAAREPIKLDALAAALGLTKSTTYRLLRVLQEEEFVEHRPSGGYRTGPAFSVLTALTAPHAPPRSATLARMRGLSERIGETVTLHRRAGDLVVQVTGVESERHPVRQVPQIGEANPLVRGCSGSAVLASLAPADVDAVIARAGLDEAARDRLRSRLRWIGETGFAVSEAENHPGVWGIAVPIPSTGPGPMAMSLAVAGPAGRWSREAAGPHLAAILGCAEHLSRSFAAGAS